MLSGLKGNFLVKVQTLLLPPRLHMPYFRCISLFAIKLTKNIGTKGDHRNMKYILIKTQVKREVVNQKIKY